MSEVDRPASLPDDLAEGIANAKAHDETFVLASQVLYFPVASSTNDLAAALAEQGAPDGTLVLAGQQTAGRGRAGHHWFSPPGAGLYMSALIDAREAPAAEWVQVLTLAAGVAMAEGLHAGSGLPVTIKWPNDLVLAPAGTVRGARKLAGILAEAHTEHGHLAHVVVGVGVNVGAATWPAEISARATSLEEEVGRPVDRGVVLAALVGRLGTWLGRLRSGQRDVVRVRWQQLAVGAVGASVEVSTLDGARRGITCGIDVDGALMVRHGSQTERVLAGEVTWL